MSELIKFDDADNVVLVIDDDRTTRKLLVKLLTAMGAARVWEAADGIEGLQLAFGEPTPALIICDLAMEPLDGFAVIGAIRTTQKSRVSKLPLVVFTASQDEAVLKAALAAGATGAISKPLNPRDLAEYLHSAMRKYGTDEIPIEV